MPALELVRVSAAPLSIPWCRKTWLESQQVNANQLASRARTSFHGRRWERVMRFEWQKALEEGVGLECLERIPEDRVDIAL